MPKRCAPRWHFAGMPGGNADDSREAWDFQEPYLRHILSFMGLTDLTFIHAENQARAEGAASLAAAEERIDGIVADQSLLVTAH